MNASVDTIRESGGDLSGCAVSGTVLTDVFSGRLVRSIKKEPDVEDSDCLLSISSIIEQCDFERLPRKYNSGDQSTASTQRTNKHQRPKIEDVVLSLRKKKSLPDVGHPGGTSLLGPQNVTPSCIPAPVPPGPRSSKSSATDGLSSATDGLFSNSNDGKIPQIKKVCSLAGMVDDKPPCRPSSGVRSLKLPDGQRVLVDLSKIISTEKSGDADRVPSSPVVSAGSEVHCKDNGIHVTGKATLSSGIRSIPGVGNATQGCGITSCEIPAAGACTVPSTPSPTPTHLHLNSQTSMSMTDESQGHVKQPVQSVELCEVVQFTGNSSRVQDQPKFRCLFPHCNSIFPTRKCLEEHLRSLPSHAMKLAPVTHNSDLSSAEACDIFLPKDQLAVERRCRVQEFLKHLSDQELKEIVLPCMVKREIFSNLSGQELESIALPSMLKLVTLWDWMEQVSRPLVRTNTECKEAKVARLVKTFEGFRGQVEEKLTEMVYPSHQRTDHGNTVEKQTSSFHSDKILSPRDIVHLTKQAMLSGEPEQVQLHSLASKSVNLVQNHLHNSNVVMSGVLGRKTASAVQAKTDCRTISRSVLASGQSVNKPSTVSGQSDGNNLDSISGSLPQDENEVDELLPHSLSLPFKLVGGKFKWKPLHVPKAKYTIEQGFDKFISKHPLRASRGILTAMIAGESFFRGYLMAALYEQNLSVFVEFAHKLALNLSLSTQKVEVLRRKVGVVLEQVLGINIFPPVAEFASAWKQLNLLEFGVGAAGQRVARKRRREEESPGSAGGESECKRKAGRKERRERESQNNKAKDDEAATEEQLQGETRTPGTSVKDGVPVQVLSNSLTTGEFVIHCFVISILLY